MTRTEELAFTIELAKSAAAVAMKHYGKVMRLTKTNRATQNEAVTEADRECQRLIVAGLRKQFPNDGMIGEESDTGADITVDLREGGSRVWVIDPIDGTNNFIAGADNFAVCIGLLERGMPVLGVVYDVTRNRAYVGAEGIGARVDDRPSIVKPGAMDEASVLMLTSNMLDKSGRAPGWINAFLSQTTWKVRILGSAALEAASVGAGISDASRPPPSCWRPAASSPTSRAHRSSPSTSATTAARRCRTSPRGRWRSATCWACSRRTLERSS
jgi:fructose-1,6-bisphosphatase/inositol monophosphatase family enzyme